MIVEEAGLLDALEWSVHLSTEPCGRAEPHWIEGGGPIECSSIGVPLYSNDVT